MAAVAPSNSARSPGNALRLRAPLVGRDHELALLENALNDAITQRSPRTMLVLGSAGVGKSRLTRELLADIRVRHPEVRVLSGQCREGGERMGVMRALLRNRLGLQEGMDAETAANALRETVGEVMGDRRVGELVHFLGAFLDLELPGSQLVQAMSDDPDQVRQVGRSVLRRFLEADAARQPLVLALDDFHLAHADAASLVHFLVRSVSNAPILFVIMARPQLFDAHPEWLELSDSHAKRLDLAPLGVDDAAAMAEHLLSPLGEAAAELIDETAELAAGNPFLVEQIVRAYIDQGVVVPGVGNAPWSVNLELMNEVQLPLSVDDAIVARIAGLSAEEKSTLEMAASMGGVFWLGALVALERAAGTPPRLWLDPTRDRKRIAALLDELVDRDYLLRLPDASIPGETEYAFKHNLEREALHKYTSRQLLARHHRVIAQWLELHLGESSEEQHELLAQHYDLGAVPGRAGHHYLQAAERARMRFNWARAADYYRRALALLGEGEGLAKLRALEHFGEALEASGQRDHALSVFEQMRGLGYQLDIVPHVASAHAHIGRLHRDLGQLPQALEHLDTAQALYESAGDEHGSASCIAAVARVQVLKGNFDAAEHMFEDAVATFEKLGDKRALLRTLLRQTSLERERANMREAELLLDRALGIARELGDDASVADALTQLGVVRDRQQEPEAAINAWNEALAIAQRISDRSRQANALACLGASAYRDGAHAEALARLTQAATMAAALGNRLLEGDVLRSLAKARAFTGEVSGALEAAQRAIEIFEAAQARPQLGVALRSYADIVAAAGNPNGLEAIGLYEQARLVLAEAGCDVEQARASLALADLLGKGSAEAADGRERAVRAEGLRSHARQLLERHSEINLRTSLVLGAPSGASKVTRRA